MRVNLSGARFAGSKRLNFDPLPPDDVPALGLSWCARALSPRPPGWGTAREVARRMGLISASKGATAWPPLLWVWVCGAPPDGGRGVAGVAPGRSAWWSCDRRAIAKGATVWPPLLVGVGVCGAPPGGGRGVAGVVPRWRAATRAGCSAGIAKGRPRGRPLSLLP